MSLFGDIWDSTAGGLLWKPLKKATGLTDAQMIGLGGMAVAAPFALPALTGAGAAGATSAAGAGSSLTGGLLNFSGTQAAAPIVDMSMKAGAGDIAGMTNGQGLLSTLGKFADPVSKGVGAASQINSMSQGQPMQAPQMQPAQANPQAFASLLSPTDQVDINKRRQAQQLAVQGLLGGYRG